MSGSVGIVDVQRGRAVVGVDDGLDRVAQVVERTAGTRRRCRRRSSNTARHGGTGRVVVYPSTIQTRRPEPVMTRYGSASNARNGASAAEPLVEGPAHQELRLVGDLGRREQAHEVARPDAQQETVDAVRDVDAGGRPSSALVASLPASLAG